MARCVPDGKRAVPPESAFVGGPVHRDGGWPSFDFSVRYHESGCPSFRGVRKLGTTDLNASHAIFQIVNSALHKLRRVAPLRFAQKKIHMVGHDHISNDHKTNSAAALSLRPAGGCTFEPLYLLSLRPFDPFDGVIRIEGKMLHPYPGGVCGRGLYGGCPARFGAESMVGGTIFHPRVIARKISRVLVLNLLWHNKTSGAHAPPRIYLPLTTPSLLTKGHPRFRAWQPSPASRMGPRLLP